MINKKLSEMEFTALDLETTGLYSGQDEILEIAAIRFNNEGILHTFNFLIKPNKAIIQNSPALKVNGITPKMLENAQNLDLILPQFMNFVKDSALVIQNAEFDLGFLMYEFSKRQIPFPTLPVFCTLNLCRKLFPERKKFGLAYLREYFSIEKMNKNSERHSFHEALDDSYACMKVFIHCVENKYSWETLWRDLAYHPKKFISTSDYEVQKWLF